MMARVNHISVLLLLSVCLFGCVCEQDVKSSGTVSEAVEIPSQADAEELLEMKLYIGGYGGNDCYVEYADDVLRYQTRPFFSEQEQWDVIEDVGTDQYEKFLNDLDSIGVFEWKSQYVDPEVRDGTQWRIQITTTTRSVESYGSNRFPGGGDAIDRGDAFFAYQKAVTRLIGESRSFY